MKKCNERERERERERQRERQRQRERERQRQRETERETEREKQRETETETERQRETERDRDRDRDRDRETERDREVLTEKGDEKLILLVVLVAIGINGICFSRTLFTKQNPLISICLLMDPSIHSSINQSIHLTILTPLVDKPVKSY